MSSILGSKRDNTEVFNEDSNKKLMSILEKYKQKHADSTANIDRDPFSNIHGLKNIDKKYNNMTNKGGKRKTRKGRIVRKTRKGRKGRRR
jgi:hypothetical protein